MNPGEESRLLPWFIGQANSFSCGNLYSNWMAKDYLMPDDV